MTSRSQAALLGGATIGILSALPIIGWANCCCLWIMTGGLVAAYVQQQNQPAPVSVADGAIAGLVAALIGAVVYVVMLVLVDAALGPIQARVVERLLESSQDVSPDMRAWLEAMTHRGVGGARLVLSFLFMLFVGSVFATTGGVLGAIAFRRSAPPPPPPLPPLPPDAGMTPPPVPPAQ